MQRTLSPGVVVAVVGMALALLGALLWFGTQPRGSAREYSAQVERQESTPEFSRAVAEMNRQHDELMRNPEAARAARDAFRDNDYQPESGR